MVKKYLWFGVAIIVLTVLAKLAVSPGAMDAGDWTALRTVLRPVSRVYLGLFGNPLSGIVLSILIFAAMAVLLWRFWFGVARPVGRVLDGVAAALRAVGNGPVTTGTLPEIRAAMQSTPLLATEWDAYERMLLSRPDGKAETQTEPPAETSGENGPGAAGARLHATVRAGDCFTMVSLREHGAPVRGWLVLPGYFVGIGLVLTFMGLVAGLYFASHGMKTADLNQARAALVSLLNASTFKFATSVAGILCSLVISMVVRAGIARVEQRLATLTATLDRLFPMVSHEQLLMEHIEVGRQQVALLNRLLAGSATHRPEAEGPPGAPT